MRNANSFSKKVALKYLHEIWWVTLAESYQADERTHLLIKRLLKLSLA
jgi:hypothetical protein